MTANTASPKPSDKFIPWCIVLFFAAQAMLFGWFVYIAETTYTGVVTERAYEKGLTYNSTIEKFHTQEALGFTSKIEHKNGKILFTLNDHGGSPVSGAEVTGLLFRPSHDGVDTPFSMKEDHGVYVATVIPPEQGLWEIRVHAMTSKWQYHGSQRVTIE